MRRFPFLLLLVVGSLVGCSRERPAARTEETIAAVGPKTAPVQREFAPATIEITGTVHPLERAVLAAKISAPIESLGLTLGQTVKRGDLLVRLAAPELSARLAQATAQLEQASREEARNRALAATGADTADAARAALERLRGARAAVNEAEAMLGYTEIHAPYDGRIAQKLAYTGDFVSAGQPLLTLENLSTLQIEAAVPASLAATLSLGATVSASIADLAVPLSCTVTEIAGAADSATHTVLIRFTLPTVDAPLSGRAARVSLAGPATEALLVPSSAVTRFGQMERVFVVADGRVHLRLVKSGAVRGDRVELLAGVATGETVVLAPSATLRDGQTITPAP